MTTFSFSYGNRGKLGQTVNFNPDNDNDGLWIEGSDVANGESAGIFMNGNTMCMWSPGDNQLLRVFDEDSLPGGSPLFVITGAGNVGIKTTPAGAAALDVNGPIFQRGVQIHADYVFGPGYEVETIEEHAEYMTRERHLAALPAAQHDENGAEVVEYGSMIRGLLEELEKAHIYIAELNGIVKDQQRTLTELSARLAGEPVADTAGAT